MGLDLICKLAAGKGLESNDAIPTWCQWISSNAAQCGASIKSRQLPAASVSGCCKTENKEISTRSIGRQKPHPKLECAEEESKGNGLASVDPIVIPTRIAGSALCHCRLAQRGCTGAANRCEKLDADEAERARV
jgi:hypothetical protein